MHPSFEEYVEEMDYDPLLLPIANIDEKDGLSMIRTFIEYFA